MKLFEIAVDALARGQALALATVVRVSGSSPRHAGAKMLVWDDGTTRGTIGGGRIERDVTQLGRRVAAGAPAERLVRHLVRDLAMCCGGSMEIYVEPLRPSESILNAVISASRAREPLGLVTFFDGTAKQVVAAEPQATSFAISNDSFTEQILPPPRLFLFGAGHVARATGPIAAAVGFEVVVCDDAETETPRALAWASDQVESFDLKDVERQCGHLGSTDYAVVVTRDHAIDERVVEQLLNRQQLAYLGLIGSRRKVERFRKRLEIKGLGSPERWSHLHAPIGLDIGAETPEEIAVAIVAELVQVRRAKTS